MGNKKTFLTCGEEGGYTRNGKPCRHPAGFGTDHVGEGKCRYHGGLGKGQPMKHGRDAKKRRTKFAKLIKKHMDNPDPLDLTREFAIIRSRIDQILSTIAEVDKMPSKEEAAELANCAESVRRLADTVSKIETREALTSREAVFLMVRLADIIKTQIAYIRREDITDEQAIKRVLKKLQGTTQVPGGPREPALRLLE